MPQSEAVVDHFFDHPIETVFHYVGDVGKHTLWQDDLVADRITEGDGGPGSIGVEERELWGRTQRSTYEVTHLEAPLRWGFRSIRGPVPMSGLLECVPDGGGTTLHVTLTFTGWAGGVMSRYARSRFEGYLRALAAVLDAHVPDPSLR